MLLPPANEVCKGYVFTHVCLSTVGRGLVPACLAGFHAHTQGGKFRGICPGGLQAHIQGEVEGDLVQTHTLGGNLGGSWSRPTPKGEIEGDLVQAHIQGGS